MADTIILRKFQNNMLAFGLSKTLMGFDNSIISVMLLLESRLDKLSFSE